MVMIPGPQGFENIGGKISAIDAGYLNQIREGNVLNHEYFHIRGHSHSIGTGDQELSALGTAGFGNWPSAAAGVILVSADAQDGVAGTGALTVIVKGLDDVAGDWVPATTTITMDGTTPTVVSAQTFIRIHEIQVVTVGANLSNEGDITASISGTDIIAVYANHSCSDSGRITISTGKIGYFENPEGSAIGNKEMTYHIFCRDNVVANSPFLLRTSWHSKDGGFRPNGKLTPATEKTDIIIIAHAEISGAKSSASFEGWIETP